MMKNKLLLLLALLMTATGAWAQEQWDVVWDFTAWSAETVTALKADAAASKTEGWSDVEKKADAEAGADPTDAAKDNCFWFAGTVNEDGSLSANGAVIKELKGLKFNSDYAAKRSLAIAVNYPSTTLGDYAGGAYLWLGGGGSKQTFPCFTIPGVKAGSKITIEVESNKTSSARGIGLYKNSYAAENLIGEQFTPTAKEAKTWEIAEDCDVVVWNTSSCHIYTIKVKAPAAAAGYTVSMKDGVKDADKWTITPNPAEEGQTVTLQYTGRLKVKGVKATSEAGAPAAPSVDLSTLTADYEAQDGEVLTGVTSSFKVTIAAGATVTLDGVDISGNGGCIRCLGDATIILKDGSTNTLTGTGDAYPALTIGDANTTLTIQGSTGVLNVTSGSFCAGIGGGYSNTNRTCGNIRIEGGVITAQGGSYGSGIGSDSGPATCGDIIITGGTITAKGGTSAAGIGTGRCTSDPGVCGDITIANTVTKVTATAGASAPYSIGKGSGSKATCGTVTIGGTKYWENNAAVNGGDTYLATSPLIYDPTAPAKEPATVTTAPTGAAVVGVGKTTALVSGGVAEGGTLWYAVTTTNTMPTSTAGFSDAVPTAKDITASGKVYVWYYVKGDDTHSDSEIAATAIEVPVAIIWDVTNISDLGVFEGAPYEMEGVTMSSNSGNIFATWTDNGDPTSDGIEFQAYETGGFTFTAPTGEAFTKIEMKVQGPDGWGDPILGTGWAYNNLTVTWKGTAAASTVDLLKGTDYFEGALVKSIAFYLSE